MVLMHVWLAAEPEAMPKVNSPAASQAYQCTSTGTVLLCSVQNRTLVAATSNGLSQLRKRGGTEMGLRRITSKQHCHKPCRALVPAMYAGLSCFDIAKQRSQNAVHTLLLLSRIAVSAQTHTDSIEDGQRDEAVPVNNWYQASTTLMYSRGFNSSHHKLGSSSVMHQGAESKTLHSLKPEWTLHASLHEAPDKLLSSVNRDIISCS